MNGDPIARRAGTQSRISGSILTTDRGPSSQLSGPIAGFLACVEDAQRLRLPSSPSPRRGPTGLHWTQFRNPNRKSRKREKGKKIGGQMLSFARDEVGIAKAMHNLKVLYDFRRIDSSKELQCTNRFQKEDSKWRLMAMRASARTDKISARRKPSFWLQAQPRCSRKRSRARRPIAPNWQS